MKIWIYVVIGIIYVISRVLKKSNQPGPPKSINPEQRPSNPYNESPSTSQGKGERTLTFEELLKEIADSKKPQQQIPSKPYIKPQTVSRPPEYTNTRPSEYKGEIRDVRKEKRPLEDVNYDDKKHDSVYEVYENAKKQAFFNPSLEETMKLGDTDMSFGKFKEFDQSYKPSLLEQYVSELKDPEGFKKAFILSEVLNRRF